MVLFLNIRPFKVELNASEGLVRLQYNYNLPNAMWPSLGLLF